MSQVEVQIDKKSSGHTSDHDIKSLLCQFHKILFTFKRNYLSRYNSDFVELEKIASGGFASVFKVNIKIGTLLPIHWLLLFTSYKKARNILDRNEYAIKKIHLKNHSQELFPKVIIALLLSDHSLPINYWVWFLARWITRFVFLAAWTTII